MLIVVKPGIVFTSLTNTSCVCAVQQEIDARHARALRRPVRGDGEPTDLLAQLVRQRRGDVRHRPVVEVLGFVVVELARGHDLAGHRRLRVVVAEHRHLDLAGVGHGGLDDDLAVELRGEVDGGRQRLRRLRLGDAHARPEVRGLHEHRESEALRDARGDDVPLCRPLAPGERQVAGHAQPGRGEQDLRDGLVHADGRSQHARAHVRHVGEFEQALHGPVFAVWTVQHGEDHVERQAAHDRAVAVRRPRPSVAARSRAASPRPDAAPCTPRDRGWRARRAPGRGAPVRSPRRRSPASAGDREGSSGRPCRCGSRSGRTVPDRCWRTPRRPTPATPRAHRTDRRRSHRHEVVSRSSRGRGRGEASA